MTRKSLLPVLCISFLLSHIAAAQQGPTATSMVIHSRADLTQAVTQIQDDLVALDRSHQAMQAAAEKLAALYSSLARKAEEVAKAGAAVKAGKPDPGALSALLEATRQMQEMQMSFNLQYLQLQSQMQNESRQYSTVSNIMKTKHDTMKNSISNIR